MASGLLSIWVFLLSIKLPSLIHITVPSLVWSSLWHDQFWPQKLSYGLVRKGNFLKLHAVETTHVALCLLNNSNSNRWDYDDLLGFEYFSGLVAWTAARASIVCFNTFTVNLIFHKLRCILVSELDDCISHSIYAKSHDMDQRDNTMSPATPHIPSGLWARPSIRTCIRLSSKSHTILPWVVLEVSQAKHLK